MSADATDLMDAVAAELADLYPTIPVYTSKRSASRDRYPMGGYQPGYASTCFVVSMADAEPIDDIGSFEEVSVGYPIVVEYIKPAMQKVTGSTSGNPSVVEDPDIRDKRKAIRQRLYKPRIAAIGTIVDIKHTNLRPGDTVADNKPLVVAGQVFTFTLWESRPA